jgi:pimeloyl-ACP methyl ester carboxylesterase
MPDTTRRRRRTLAASVAALAIAAGAIAFPLQAASADGHGHAPAPGPKPTVVLVHGAWADSSSFAPVTAALQRAGYPVLVPPNDLRGIGPDAAALSAYLAQRTSGPVVLVGHSYGGAVITNAGASDPDVKALVYIDAFLPEQGETINDLLAGSGSALTADPSTLFDIVAPPGATSQAEYQVYLKSSTFATSFAQDVPAATRNVLAAGQLPPLLGALADPSGPPAWKTIRSWDVIGTQDKVIPPATQYRMAQRAGSTIVPVRASHLSMISQPAAVTAVIERAAATVR